VKNLKDTDANQNCFPVKLEAIMMQVYMTPERSMCLTPESPLQGSEILVWNSADINKEIREPGSS